MFATAMGYVDPAVDALLNWLDSEVSSPIRDALIEQIWRKVLGDIVVVPLYRASVVWAMRGSLELPVAPGAGVPKFRDACLTSSGAR